MRKLLEVSIHDPGAVALVEQVLHSDHPLVMLQMPTVYTLIAPPTRRGIEALNGTKARLVGKNYGSAIGSTASFHALADRERLPQALREPSSLSILEGSFIRFRIAPIDFSSTAVHNGTHQGLLLAEGPHRHMFKVLEQSLAPLAEPELFGGKNYTSVLCTSANLSGDPLGSITDEARDAAFARDRDVKLWIRCEPLDGELGSFPIFFFDTDRVSVERQGPGMREILYRLPSSILRV